MTSPVVSVIIASASSVGKTFIIGLVGYLATKFPTGFPLIPPSSLSALSRMSFIVLILPLIYSGVASSVSLSELESLYPVMIFSVVILAISFLTTVILGILFGMRKETYFVPLCIASTFPNIVALPIIIFPTLCEYDVVQDLVREDIIISQQENSTTSLTEELDLMEVCKKQVNAIVFTYFFGFSVLFWSIGYRTLTTLRVGVEAGVEAAYCYEDLGVDSSDANGNSRHLEHTINENNDDEECSNPKQSTDTRLRSTQQQNRTTCSSTRQQIRNHGMSQNHSSRIKRLLHSTKDMVISICSSSGFIALILGFVTACIPPLQRALFETGGSLRVLGSALESLSTAGTTFATMIVAASLVNIEEPGSREQHMQQEQEHSAFITSPSLDGRPPIDEDENDAPDTVVILENQLNIHDESRTDNLEVSTTRRTATDCANNAARKWSCLSSAIERKTLIIDLWQILARLFVTPGIIFAILMETDCSKFLQNVPNIAKLVLLINAAVPGALVVVVILKAEGFTNEAAAVSKTYLPSYCLSVFTLAMWSSLGLMAFRPENRSCS